VNRELEVEYVVPTDGDTQFEGFAGAEGRRLLFVSTDRRITNVSVDSVRQIEVVHDRGRSMLEGAGWGSAIGFGTGALLGFASGDDHCTHDCFVRFSAGDKAVILGTAIGVVGLVVGLIAGLGRGERDVFVLEPQSPLDQ
jgi:hypothetical protein